MAGTGRGAQLGILVRGPEVLEQTRRITTVVLDKTGTVTEGRMVLTGRAPPERRQRAPTCCASPGALEDASEHPIGRAVAAAAHAELGALPAVESLPQPARRRRLRAGRGARRRGRPLATVACVVGWDGEPRAELAVEDTVKPTSAEAIRELERLGLTPVLLTGDAEESGAADRRARSGSSGSSPTRCPATSSPRSRGCRPRARSSRWSATASTTRRRSPRPTSASRSAPAPTSRSRRAT